MIYSAVDEAKKRFPPIWVIYNRPRDFPGLIVCRVWYGEVASDEIMVAGTMDEMHGKLIAAGASVSLGRMPEDDPCIVECWV